MMYYENDREVLRFIVYKLVNDQFNINCQQSSSGDCYVKWPSYFFKYFV